MASRLESPPAGACSKATYSIFSGGFAGGASNGGPTAALLHRSLVAASKSMADAGMKLKVLSSHAMEFISDLPRCWEGTGHTGEAVMRRLCDRESKHNRGGGLLPEGLVTDVDEWQAHAR